MNLRRLRTNRGQRGASLILVLALTTFLFILVPSVLNLATTGSRVTPPVVKDRRALYAATSAIDAAVQFGQQETYLGTPVSGFCPDLDVLEIDEFDVVVDCTMPPVPTLSNGDPCPYLGTVFANRYVTFVAKVLNPDWDAANDPPDEEFLQGGTAGADVVYRDDTGQVEVRRFSNDAVRAPTFRPPDYVCSVDPPPDPDPPPAAGVEARSTWSSPDPATPATFAVARGQGWRAEGSIRVVNENGDPVEGARAEIRFRYRLAGTTTWVEDTTLFADTTETGSAAVYSSTYKRNGNGAVDAIEMSIVALDAAGRTWVNGADPSLTVVVAAP